MLNMHMTLDHDHSLAVVLLTLTNRDELLFRLVLALPNASRAGFD